MNKRVMLVGLTLLIITISPYVLNSDPSNPWSFISGYTSLVTGNTADDLFPNTFMDSSGTVHAVFQSNRDEGSPVGIHPESFDIDALFLFGQEACQDASDRARVYGIDARYLGNNDGSNSITQGLFQFIIG